VELDAAMLTAEDRDKPVVDTSSGGRKGRPAVRK